MTYQWIADELGKTGYCICPEFLSSQSLIDTNKDFETTHKAGLFRHAQVGQGDWRELSSQVRNDETYCLDRDHSNPVRDLLWAQLDLLKTAFNRNLFLGLNGFEGHYASYPTGGHYERHLDSFRKVRGRVVSVVFYLNKNWILSDGGQLRIYHPDSHTDVDPVGGTMVCFLSQESEHEVLESHSKRSSFVGWFTS